MSILTKQGLIRLFPLNLHGDHMDEMENICSTFGYVFIKDHDKNFKLAPIITNGDGTRFGYLQIKIAYRVKQDCSIVLPFVQKEPLNLRSGDYFDFDKDSNMIQMEDSYGIKHWVPLHYFMFGQMEMLREVKCIYFVFRNLYVNLTRRYQLYLKDKETLKSIGYYTKQRDLDLKKKWVIEQLAPTEFLV